MFFLCVLYRTVFPTHLLHLKYTLGHSLDPSTLSPLISDICGHFVFFYCVHSTEQSFEPFFFKFTPNVHWTNTQTPINFHHPLVKFVASRGPNSFFFLCPLYRAEFSTHLFQIHTKYLFDQDLDYNSFSLPICDFCGHQGINFIFRSA